MSSVRSRNRTASNITRSCSEPHQRRNVSRETFPKSPSPEEMPGRAEELSTLFEKRNRRGEHCSPETPPSSLRLATSSVEEALSNCLLFQRRCPTGQRSIQSPLKRGMPERAGGYIILDFTPKTRPAESLVPRCPPGLANAFVCLFLYVQRRHSNCYFHRWLTLL